MRNVFLPCSSSRTKRSPTPDFSDNSFCVSPYCLRFSFVYNADYLQKNDAKAVSLTLPLRENAFNSQVMFPFFDGLIPEGWLLDIAVQSWKINLRDRMSLLLACCKDCIGAVSIVPLVPLINEEI